MWFNLPGKPQESWPRGSRWQGDHAHQTLHSHREGNGVGTAATDQASPTHLTPGRVVRQQGGKYGDDGEGAGHGAPTGGQSEASYD